MMFRSLAFKWVVTLLLTSLIGVVLVGLFAYRTTASEYDRLRIEQAQALFEDNVTAYFRARGTLTGIDAWLRREGFPDSPRNAFAKPQLFALVDADGIVIAGHGPFRVGDPVDAEILQQGTPILIDGEPVGTALTAQPPPDLDPRERQYIDGTNRALLIGAVGASAAALLIGVLLSRQFLRPLSDLTRAITRMHHGELDQQVKIRTRDELGILGQTFNEMSASLHRANQLRRQMTADIAHDLRTPLTVIAGYLEALRDGTLKPTPERFRVMSEEAALLQRSVEDLRMLSLADSGELKLVQSTFAPRELLERVAGTFVETAAARGIALHVECADDLPEVKADAERLVQVMGNLVSNALRHTPQGGSVTLRAWRDAGTVQLAVIDTGSGIEPDDLPRVFDRFYRADPSRQMGQGETGLGLAIAKSIVEAHGGEIRAESKVDHGTSMIITLRPEERSVTKGLRQPA